MLKWESTQNYEIFFLHFTPALTGTKLGFELEGGKHNQKKVSQMLILANQKMHTHHNINLWMYSNINF